MTVKTAASKFSDADSVEGGVTLAIAVEATRNDREAVQAVKAEMLTELERFRSAMRHEMKARKRKVDAHDALLAGGLLSVAVGVAVAFHWAYSLIITGGVFITLALTPLLRPAPVKE